MKENSNAIIILCSHLCLSDGITPFEPAQWTKLAERLMEVKLQPADLLRLDKEELLKYFTEEQVEKIKRLSSRSASLSFELNKYTELGINIITRADEKYPKMLKKKLGKSCPPLFYYVGDLSLLDNKYMGFVGSRKVDANDADFTRAIVKGVVDQGYSVVSGGARGVDEISAQTCIENGGCVIEYISDSLNKKIKKKDVITAIRNKQLLILSMSKPDAPFNTGMAMNRNKYIYAQSNATVVVRSDYNKGGTWTGANEAIKKEYCKVLCWKNLEYKGNQVLIENGASPIDVTWDTKIPQDKVVQLSLFEKV